MFRYLSRATPVFCWIVLSLATTASPSYARERQVDGKDATRPLHAKRTSKDRLKLVDVPQATAQASQPAPSGKPAGDAEAKLIGVYRQIGAGQTASALRMAEQLVADYPNFQLGQLVYGDLLSARIRPLRVFGDVPESAAKAGQPVLQELRDESLARLRALRERPPPGTIPSQFVQLSRQNRHAIAVDASRSRLYLFDNTGERLQLVGDYYISVGKSGIEKVLEGDMRTPLGVYFITNTLSRKSLKDFYGTGALPINYPNPLDVKRGKTGSGIWLHGTPPNQFARAPKASDGCVVLSNPDLDHIIRTVEIRTTPVVIAQSIEWVAPNTLLSDAASFQTTLQAWKAAKATGNLQRTLSYYAADFQAEGKDLAAFSSVVQREMEAAKSRDIQLKDLSFLRWKDTSTDTMVVTFGEVVEGNIKGPRKRQYWHQQNKQWKIFFEGIVG